MLLFDVGLERGVVASRDVDLVDLRRVSVLLRHVCPPSRRGESFVHKVVRAKAQAIRDHVRRIREVDPGSEAGLAGDLLHQKSILFIQRACQAAIDVAQHLAERHDLGALDDSRDAFRAWSRPG